MWDPPVPETAATMPRRRASPQSPSVLQLGLQGDRHRAQGARHGTVLLGPIGDLAEILDVTEESLDTASATAGGWTIEKFGAFPKVGDTVESDGLRVKVLAMGEDGLRVEKILVEKLPEDETDK